MLKKGQAQVQEPAPDLTQLYIQAQSLDLYEPRMAKMVESFFRFKTIDQVLLRGSLVKLTIFGKQVGFKVVQAIPERGRVTKSTVVDIKPAEGAQEHQPVQCFGLQRELMTIRLCIKKFQQSPVLTASQILVQGPSGSGKSTLFASIRPEFNLRLVSGRDYSGVGQQFMRQVADLKSKLTKQQVLIVDEAEYIKRPLVWNGITFYLSRQPLPFRTDKTITLQLPSPADRSALLAGYIRKIGVSLQAQDLAELALKTIGYSPADLLQIVRQTYFLGVVSKQTILKTIKLAKPASLAKVVVQVPHVSWEDIGGYSAAKRKIQRALDGPLKFPQKYKAYGVAPIKGILLYGPPGCSKTLMARAIASNSNYFFLAVKGPELFSKYVGDSEKTVRDIFSRARACSPCVVFFDEIDALAGQRSQETEVSDRVLLMLLNQMDGISQLKDVVVIAATNRPDTLDRALLRPGRIDHLIYIGLPDEQARQQILQIGLRRMPIEQSQAAEWAKELAGRTQGLTGAELCHLVKVGVLQFLDSGEQSIGLKFFEDSLRRVRPRVEQKHLDKFKTFQTSWGEG